MLNKEFQNKLKANEDKLSQTPQDIKNLNEKLKKLEGSQNHLEKNVENMNFSEFSLKVKKMDIKLYSVVYLVRKSLKKLKK